VLPRPMVVSSVDQNGDVSDRERVQVGRVPVLYKQHVTIGHASC
jgi:hypothetical protein